MGSDVAGYAHGTSLAVAPEVSDALDAATIDVDTGAGQPQLVIVPAG